MHIINFSDVICENATPRYLTHHLIFQLCNIISQWAQLLPSPSLSGRVTEQATEKDLTVSPPPLTLVWCLRHVVPYCVQYCHAVWLGIAPPPGSAATNCHASEARLRDAMIDKYEKKKSVIY